MGLKMVSKMMLTRILLCFFFIYIRDESSCVYSSRVIPVIKRSKLKCVSKCVESSKVLNVKAVASDTFLSCAAKAVWHKRSKKHRKKKGSRQRRKCLSNILRFTFMQLLALAGLLI